MGPGGARRGGERAAPGGRHRRRRGRHLRDRGASAGRQVGGPGERARRRVDRLGGHPRPDGGGGRPLGLLQDAVPLGDLGAGLGARAQVQEYLALPAALQNWSPGSWH